MKIKKLLNIGSLKLKKAGIKTHQLDAEILMAHILKKSREYILANMTSDILQNIRVRFLKLVKKRGKRYPLAYILHHKEFYGLDFFVDKNVLVPRPETEMLVENILKILKKNPEFSLLEIGTGSGCISISIAKNINNKIIASDISLSALAVAKKNAKFHKIEKKIKFVKSNLLSSLKNKSFDIIVANLPYVGKYEIKDELVHEPKEALVGGAKPTDLIEKLFKQISKTIPEKTVRLTSGRKYNDLINKYPKIILLEIGDDQGMVLKKLARKYLPEYSCKILQDLAGKDRVLRLEFKSNERG